MKRQLVAAPTVTPSVNTLLDYVQWRDGVDPHWQAGITWQSVCGEAQGIVDFCVVTGSAAPNPAKNVTADMPTRGAQSFTVQARIDCSPVGFWDNAQDNVRNILGRMESLAVGRAFWTGDLAGSDVMISPHLAANAEIFDSTDVVPVLIQPAMNVAVTGTVDVTEGLGALEYALDNCYGGVGYVHVTIPVFEQLVAELLVFKVNGRWQTAKGNWVVADGGYNGVAPDGTAPAYGVNWMYITGQVFGYRSGIKVNGTNIEMFDRSVNTLEVIAERTYVLGWDCCQYGVAVSYGGTITGTAHSAT